MTLQEEFNEYVTRVYGNQLSEHHADERVRDQYKQLRQAFFGGCLVAHANPSDLRAELRAFRDTVRQELKNG